MMVDYKGNWSSDYLDTPNMFIQYNVYNIIIVLYFMNEWFQLSVLKTIMKLLNMLFGCYGGRCRDLKCLLKNLHKNFSFLFTYWNSSLYIDK